VRHTIDDPIDAAIESFTPHVPVSEPIDAVTLLEAAGEFVAHTYKHGLVLPRVLKSEQAQAEGLYLLDRAYQGAEAAGFEGILCDMAQCGADGLRMFFLVLGGIIKDIQREQYLRWVLASHITEQDWRVRRDLTAIILQRWGMVLGEITHGQSVEQLLPACADLVRAYASSDEALCQKWHARSHQ